ncbi:glutathione S-transferase family protein [Ruegeria sp. HKCCD8929]|uniref:glutathione S-transferase family protein n=1 Tax=Ruegeria sp. HKCCD8929 TaxID=2683006 RepID=UPI00148925A7|nr:glutathione S-transferase family protein [Ruegeria sp. HKCCD8929]
MLTIWGRKTSSNVQALMWCVGELRLPYRRHDAGHRFGGLDTDAFAALNPNRTIPVLRDGDNPPLWETGAILRYLAARYGDDQFWPRDPLRRAETDKWAEWAKLNVAMAFTVPVFWRVVRTTPADRDPAAIRAAIDALETKLTIADTRLGLHPYLAGDTFTLADIQLGHVLYRYYNIDIDRAPLPNLARYHQNLTDRPTYREHVMLSYDELKAD